MFSGYGVSADGINFALVLRGAVYLRADERSVARFEAEGCGPFSYEAKGKVRTIGSYWQLPERLYDEPDEVTEWAKAALAAAERAALAKRSRVKKTVLKRDAGESGIPRQARAKNASPKYAKKRAKKAQTSARVIPDK